MQRQLWTVAAVSGMNVLHTVLVQDKLQTINAYLETLSSTIGMLPCLLSIP